MLEFAQGSLLLGLGALVGYLLARRIARRDYDKINKRLDDLRIEIRQLPTIEIRSPIDLTPITTMIETLEHRVTALAHQMTEPQHSKVGKDTPRVLGTELFNKKDSPPT